MDDRSTVQLFLKHARAAQHINVQAMAVSAMSSLSFSSLSLALSSLSVFDTEFFFHFPNTPPPSLFAIYATLYLVLGPPGLDSRDDVAASALHWVLPPVSFLPTLPPPGCNRPGGGDLWSGVSGERGDF